jgi:hypothetical protein
MCRHATIYVSAYMQVYMCAHATLHVSSHMQAAAPCICVSSCYYMCPHPHATIDVCSCDYTCVLIYASRSACRRHDPHTAYCPSTSHELLNMCHICKAQSPSTSRSSKAGCRTAYCPSASHERGVVMSRCLRNACNKCNKKSWPHCRRR